MVVWVLYRPLSLYISVLLNSEDMLVHKSRPFFMAWRSREKFWGSRDTRGGLEGLLNAARYTHRWLGHRLSALFHITLTILIAIHGDTLDVYDGLDGSLCLPTQHSKRRMLIYVKIELADCCSLEWQASEMPNKMPWERHEYESMGCNGTLQVLPPS